MTYVFVGGSQRTGTSIAQQLLCQLPDANPYVHEANYLRQMLECYVVARRDFNDSHACYFGTVQQLRDFNAGVINAFLEQVRERLGGMSHLILKEPQLTMYWPFLYELVPNAKFVMMVRDPRDVIASMVQVGEKQKALGQNYLFVDRNIPQMCQHFLSFYKPSLAATTEGFRDQLGIVRYEDLVDDPKDTLRDITSHTQVPFDQIDTESELDSGHVDSAKTQASDVYTPWATQLTGQQVSKRRVGNYLNALTADEVRQVEAECSEFFGWFGYERQAA